MNTYPVPELRIYQICYDELSMANVPQGMLALDNMSNSRPDWREYWPIRQFLLNTPMEDGVLYGFFSPKFAHKTGLNAQKIEDFLARHYRGESVVGFSPYWDMGAFFTNTIEQGDYFHPGLRDAAMEFVVSTGYDTALIDQWMSCRECIFCNYFLADRSFWLEWLQWGEVLFALSEKGAPEPAGRNIFSEDTSYGKQQVPRKVFLMERLASLILSAKPEIRVLNEDPFQLPGGCVGLEHHWEEGVVCDALKRKWLQTGAVSALKAFISVRNKVFERLITKEQEALEPLRSH